MARFKKGQSGNPGGRPKVAAEVKELAREHGREAIEKLVYLMQHAEKEELQRAAAVDLLDRGYGKPTQTLAGDDEKPPVQLVMVDMDD